MTGGCCSFPEIDFDSQEAKDGRIRIARQYGKLALYQLPVAALAIISGGATFGLAFGGDGADWPYSSIFSALLGIWMLVVGISGRTLSGYEPDKEVPRAISTAVTLHYVFSINALSFTGLSCGFSGQGLGMCLSDNPEKWVKCTPNMDVMKGFLIANIVLAVLLWPTAGFGMYLHREARKFGLYRRSSYRCSA